jgi:hypothetical protein
VGAPCHFVLGIERLDSNPGSCCCSMALNTKPTISQVFFICGKYCPKLELITFLVQYFVVIFLSQFSFAKNVLHILFLEIFLCFVLRA